MKKLPLIFLVLSLIFICAEAQTKKTPKAKKTKVQPAKTVTPTKTAVVPKTATVAKTPDPTPTKTPIPIAEPSQTITLSKFETDLFAELNLFRRNPQAYAQYVEDYLKTFDGKYFKNGNGISLASFEGKVPVEEVVAALKTTEPLPEFKLADGMIKAAADHAQDLVKNNITGHRGTNGSLPDDRVKIYGFTPTGVNENISYGAKTARDIVLTMLIDDGNKNRSHRRNMLNPQLKIIGLATGEIKSAGLACVLIFTNSFSDKPK